MMVACMTFGPIKERVFYCKGNLMIKHNTQILARGSKVYYINTTQLRDAYLARGIQRENYKDSPSKGGLHKEQSA